MLAKAHRITRGADYRAIVRRGRRVALDHTVTYVRSGSSESPVRFGFIVGKAVGNAVRRNRLRRQMKAVCLQLLPQLREGTDIVVRALPASADVTWATLQEEITRAVTRGSRRP